MSTHSHEPDTNEAFLHKGMALETEAAQCFEDGNLWQALVLQRQAMQAWRECSFPEREAQCAHIAGYLCFRLNDNEGALAAYLTAANLRARLDDFCGMAISLVRAAEVQQHLGNHRKALELLQIALPNWNSNEHRKERGIALNNMGVSHGALGQKAKAQHCYEQALKLRREIDDEEGLAASLHNIGALCFENEEPDLARRYLNEAAQIRRGMNAKAELGRTLLQLGLLHEQEGDLAQAVCCYEQAWRFAVDPDVNDPNDEAAALHNLGVAAESSGDHAYALRLLEQSQTILIKTGKKHGLAMSHYHCGLVHRALKEPIKAMGHFFQAKRLQEDIEDRSGLAATLTASAVLLAEARVLPQAYDLLVQARAIQNELGQDDAQLHSFQLLAQICEMQGKHEEALHYQRMVSPNTVSMIIQRAKTPEHTK